MTVGGMISSVLMETWTWNKAGVRAMFSSVLQ